MAPLVRTGGSRHTGLAALPHRNIQLIASFRVSLDSTLAEKFIFLLSTRGDFEECQTIFYKIKKETLTVIVSA